uniref:Medium-chain specific acyl-CoA dehydrogenase, mitochondrial n=2 Tax=Steinernema glaseri TaxID=37863 RepID=A0A1I8AH77_9BILA
MRLPSSQVHQSAVALPPTVIKSLRCSLLGRRASARYYITAMLIQRLTLSVADFLIMRRSLVRLSRNVTHNYSAEAATAGGYFAGFDLTEAQIQLHDSCRRFVKQEVIPTASKYDESGKFPWEIFRKAHECGFTSSDVPEECGGLGLDLLSKSLIFEQLGYGCTGVGTIMMVNDLAQTPLILAGSDYLRQKYLVPMLEDAHLAAYAVTEAGAGSDVAGVSTRATRDGDSFILNGSKVWITNCGVAKWFFVLARTNHDTSCPTSKAFTGFVVDADQSGVIIGKKERNMGQRCSDTRAITFENVRVPMENVVGEVGGGFKIVMRAFDRTRPLVSAMATGLSQRALDEAGAYSLERKTFGKRIADHQAIAFKLANMAMNVELARLMTRKSAYEVENQRPSGNFYSSIAKCFAADIANKNASEAIQIFGGNGFNTEYPVEKLLRDAKILQIYGGTSEIQRVVVAKNIIRSMSSTSNV